MHESLVKDWEEIDQLLAETLREASLLLQSLERRSPGGSDQAPSSAVLSLPAQGSGAASMLRMLMERYAESFSGSAGPRYWAFVTGGATPAALMGDWIASTIDQNAADPLSPTTHIELEALAMLRQLFGLGSAHHGSFVTGATISNFVGLACGRQWVGRQYNVDIAQEGLTGVPPIKVLSAVPHSSIYKALSMLGIGRNAIQKVDTLPGRESIDLKALEIALEEFGQPCIVCASAGTVNTVDFDDIQGIVQLRKKFPFWLHVDAAFGGFAACSAAHADLLAGWDEADSICVDAHKWLNVPYDSAIQLTLHPHLQIETFNNAGASYLETTDEQVGFVHRTPENSRRFRALPAWCTLVAYGSEGYRDIVERNCHIASVLGDWVDSRPEFELLAPVRLNGVVFTLRGRPDMPTIRDFLERLRQGGKLFLTPTMLFGVAAVRVAVVNWRSDLVDVAVAQRALIDALEAPLE